MTVLNKKSIKGLAFIAIIGVLAGFTNGFLGAGGGIILLYALSKLNPEKGPLAVRDNFAAVVGIVLLLSTVSAVTYSYKNELDVSSLASIAVPGAIGGVLGAYLTDKLDTNILKGIFSIIIIIAGINMII